VQGSLEAIKGMLEKIKVTETSLNIIHAAIGTVSDSDIQLAKASNAVIICFNVRPSSIIKQIANEQQIKFYYYNIIYKLKDDIINMLYGSLDPVYIEKDIGECQVKQT
jgi:translation initiation factor IF-2